MRHIEQPERVYDRVSEFTNLVESNHSGGRGNQPGDSPRKPLPAPIKNLPAR